jgi:hypothetical protein
MLVRPARETRRYHTMCCRRATADAFRKGSEKDIQGRFIFGGTNAAGEAP